MINVAKESVLLDPDEPKPVALVNAAGRSPWLLTCEHGGRRLPRALGDLGLEPPAFERHIAWDIGALGIARALAEQLDAPLVHQLYSRLVVDCNRPPDRPSFIPELSEATAIPGNRGLDDDARTARRGGIWQPFQDAVASAIEGRSGLLAIHTFTDVFLGVARPWHVGFLHGLGRRLANHLHDHFAALPGIEAALNEPYRIDVDDYTIPVHGDGRGIAAVLVEIRQDLVADEAGQERWAAMLADALAGLDPAQAHG